jgi:hypothetical protein
MRNLVFGVVDIPYGFAYGEDTENPDMTTGDVADFLEADYAIMQNFFKKYEAEILELISNYSIDILNDILNGTPIKIESAISSALPEIRNLFEKFILEKEMDYLVSGVPTKRSKKGIIHRKKKVYYEPYRPSFLDSRMYMSSFRAYIDD